MNMEELTKSQIVLLTLLVSFVTSIATGIVTVSLVQQAPPAITQTVSRVIQETVQTVSPQKSGQPAAAATVTQEKTVVLNESDLVSEAVAQASASVVRLYAGPVEPDNFAGLGVVLTADGTVAADADSLPDIPDAVAVLPDGTQTQMLVRKRDAAADIAYLQPATSTTQAAISWTPIAIAGDHAVLGQEIIALSGGAVPRIASGLVVALAPSGAASTSPQVVETDVAGSSLLSGSPLIDEQGALVGISTGNARSVNASGFISASVLSY